MKQPGGYWQGLSPLARGNRQHPAHVTICQRSIPACAGEPGQGRVALCAGRVYPRLRGGTVLGRFNGGLQGGLSPLARGNQPDLARTAALSGSIPACAGEPVVPATSRASRGVYPRLRGGTDLCCVHFTLRWGLSPLARGNHGMPAPPSAQPGSIPACAGEPRPSPNHRCAGRVYPRLRGGTSIDALVKPSCRGLSPLARGNHTGDRRGGRFHGSIPACAGEPNRQHVQFELARVYPRLRGGTGALARDVLQLLGLSPLARGNHLRNRPRGFRKGSIPACAGEPGLRCCGSVR